MRQTMMAVPALGMALTVAQAKAKPADATLDCAADRWRPASESPGSAVR